MASAKTEHIQVTAHVQGIMKRERKVKLHRIELMRLKGDADPVMTEAIEREAKRKIPLLMRAVERAQISFRYETEEDAGNGIIMRGTHLFDERNKSYELEVKP